MAHAGFRRDVPERDRVDGLFLDAALEGHEDIHAHFFSVNNDRHGCIVAQIYQLVNKSVDSEPEVWYF